MAQSGEHEHDHEEHIVGGRNAVEKQWQDAWYEGDCKNANRDVSKWLKEHIGKLTDGKSNLRIFVPMCGAARDLHWLLEQGHVVIGVELVDKALTMFLERHGIKYTESSVPSIPGGKCYKSDDGKLTLYKCNIFDLDTNLIGKVDGMWESGAMTDIPPQERVRYGEVLLSLLSPGGRILAETFTFGETEDAEGGSAGHDDHGHGHHDNQGHGHGHDTEEEFPCRPVEMVDFERMYGKTCKIEMIAEEDSDEAEDWGPNWWFKNRLHLVVRN
ncbi:probable thiopurine S-methyltransferase [Diadema setosum]|uniref:probable thiopurine S-methyltransferase n=1 Tax=Diadema setosum TaxID=31175 RepID=UPI003B3A3002